MKKMKPHTKKEFSIQLLNFDGASIKELEIIFNNPKICHLGIKKIGFCQIGFFYFFITRFEFGKKIDYAKSYVLLPIIRNTF